MTNQEINIAIAKACGWSYRNADDGSGEYWHNPQGKIKPDDLIPSYTIDLNAMHGAEKTLTDDKEGVYEAHIYLVCDVEPDTIFASDMRKVICATALQRAEAFLRTLNKWKE